MIKNLFIILIISLTLVIGWFREGFIMGTAEAVLPFYNLERYYHLTEYAWTFHPGLGNFAGTTVASKLTYYVLSSLQTLGLPGFILQAATFLFIILSAGFGMYFFTRQLFPKLPERFFLVSALFYLFNPISLVNVWNRFLLNFMFFYSLLPLSLLIFNKGLSERKYYYAILLSIVLLFYTFAFSALVFVILLWTVLGIFSLFYFLTAKTLKDKLFIIKYLVLSLAFFVLTNLWYLTQLLNYTAPASFQSNVRTFHPQQININTLDSLSNKMGNLTDLYRLNNSWFFSEVDLDWIGIYRSYPVLIAGLLTTALVLYGLLKAKKQKEALLLGFIFFTTLFLSKGSNPPFGFVYSFIFENLPFFQVFRNPIEKFSFALIVVFAPLLSLGLFHASNAIPKKLVTAFATLLLIVWSYPFFNSLVFTSPNPPNNTPEVGFKVDVPWYYERSSQFIESYGNNFRVIGFPIADEGITYLWNKGYQGADIPSALFNMPVIFFNTTVPFYYDLVKEVEPALSKDGDFTKVANLLNARFLFTRGDIDFKARNLTDPQEIENQLIKREKQGEIKKVGEFGKLKIWENKSWQDMTFYPASNIVATSEASLENFKTLKPDEALYEGSQFFENKTNQPLPKITYKKINPTFYKVRVENANTPFVLVFSETYNPNWQAAIDNKIITNHFRANLYANAWIIEKQGSFDLEINFTPQQWLDYTQTLSLLAFVVGCAYLVFFRRKS